MIWPPVKAWTSKVEINNQIYFVAINYGGTLLTRWVILMSVIDSDVLVKVPWSKLLDPSNWESGWNKKSILTTNKLVVNKSNIKKNELTYPSDDSGLTIPITNKAIRPWFNKD